MSKQQDFEFAVMMNETLLEHILNAFNIAREQVLRQGLLCEKHLIEFRTAHNVFLEIKKQTELAKTQTVAMEAQVVRKQGKLN